MWVAWQPDWEEKVFSLSISCCRVWVWCDSVRDENLPHHTRIDFFLPQLTQSHRSGRIPFTASSQSRKSCSLWYWSFLAVMSSLGDCLRGNTGARLTLQDMTSPPHEVNEFPQPVCDPKVSSVHAAFVVSDVGQSSATGGPQWGSEPGLSGSGGGGADMTQ